MVLQLAGPSPDGERDVASAPGSLDDGRNALPAPALLEKGSARVVDVLIDAQALE